MYASVPVYASVCVETWKAAPSLSHHLKGTDQTKKDLST